SVGIDFSNDRIYISTLRIDISNAKVSISACETSIRVNSVHFRLTKQEGRKSRSPFFPFDFYLFTCALPAWLAVVASAATTVIATATAVAATITVASAAIATASTATAASLRPGFVDGQITTVQILAVELFDGSRSAFGGRHFDEA